MPKVAVLNYSSCGEYSHSLNIFVHASFNYKVLRDLCDLVNEFMSEDDSFEVFLVDTDSKKELTYFTAQDSDENYSYQKDAVFKESFNDAEGLCQTSISISDSPCMTYFEVIFRHHFSNNNVREMKANMLEVLRAKKSGNYYRFPEYYEHLESAIY